jgi:nucleotide-binding universal stress UspA family protein
LATEVLPFVQALALKTQAEVALFRAYREPDDATHLGHVRESAQHYLNVIADRFTHVGIPVKLVTEQGDAAESILDAADALHADLIAMSTHGHSGIRRFVVGSVADRVVHYARVPVLLVRPTA